MEHSKKRNTKKVGDRSEIEVIAAFLRAGVEVFRPVVGENQRYDLIIDKDGELSRVQVKTGRLRNGVIIFNCYSSHSHRNGPGCWGYVGEIELFAVYCPDLDGIYLVPVDEAPLQGFLRVEPTRNGQWRRIRWASDYVFGGASPAKVGTPTELVVPSSSPGEPPL